MSRSAPSKVRGAELLARQDEQRLRAEQRVELAFGEAAQLALRRLGSREQRPRGALDRRE